MLELQCTKCGSDNTQKLSLAVEGGTFSGSSFSIGAGGSRNGGGMFGASTTGSSKSHLAEKYAAPEKLPVIGAFFLVMLFAAIAAIFVGYAAIEIGVILATLLALRSFRKNQKYYPTALAEWQARYICLRCSEVFTPGLDQEAAQPVSNAAA